MARIFASICASELRELIRDIPDDGLVAFASDYGDHCHTEQVHSLGGEIEERPIRESAYSESGFAVASHEYDDAPVSDIQTVYIIS